MRIAFVTTSYPETKGDCAGHFVETEALLRSREGHEVHVLSPGTVGVRAEGDPGAPITVWRLGGQRLFGREGALPRLAENPLAITSFGPFAGRAVLRLRALRPLERVVAHFIVPSAYPLALAATGALEVVLHGSDVRLLLALPHGVRLHVVRRLLRRAARFRFVSRALQAEFTAALEPRERRLVAERSRVELPSISVPEAPARRPEPRASENWVVCGRLIASKRVDLAIREAARKKARLTIVGDGPLRRELEALAASLDVDARFVGQLARSDALSSIAGADKLVCLSAAEGAPTVIREARALGVPVLATPVGDVAAWAAADEGIELFALPADDP